MHDPPSPSPTCAALGQPARVDRPARAGSGPPPRHDTLPRIPHQPSDDSHQGAPVLHRKIRLVLLIMQLYPSGLAGLLIIDMIASGQPPLEPS